MFLPQLFLLTIFQMDNEKNFSIRSRVAGGAGGRFSMDSFLFHPARASFHWSASIGRGINSSFPPLSGPLLQPNSSILSNLLHSDVSSFSSNQPIQGFSSNPMTASDLSGSVQDLFGSPHGVVSSVEVLNLPRGQTEPSSFQNPPILSPIQPNPHTVSHSTKSSQLFISSWESSRLVPCLWKSFILPI